MALTMASPAQSFQVQATKTASIYLKKAKETALNFRTQAIAAAKDRKVQVTAASAASGTVFVGFCGGAVGMVVGGTVGAAVGLPFALFALGLSIPFTAVVGGAIGAGTGAVGAGTAGCVGGGAMGHTIFTKRVEIWKALNSAWLKAKANVETTKAYALGKALTTYSRVTAQLTAVKTLVTAQAIAAADTTKATSSELGVNVRRVAADPQAQVTAASAAGGGLLLGTGGGVVGLVTGGTLGAVVGIVPALFTFGLSIPICAMIGGGAGFFVGTTVGGTVGMVGGGAAGYGAYGKRAEIQSTVNGCTEYVKDTASISTEDVKEKAVAAKIYVGDKATAAAAKSNAKKNRAA